MIEKRGIKNKVGVLVLCFLMVLGMMALAEATNTVNLSLDMGQPALNGSATDITAVVSVEAGTVAGVSVGLTMPSNVVLKALYIDGETKTTSLNYALGTMTAGGSYTVKWSVVLTVLGVNNFSVKAVSADSVTEVTKTGQKCSHRQGALGKKLALVDIGGNECTAIKNQLIWLGWENASNIYSCGFNVAFDADKFEVIGG